MFAFETSKRNMKNRFFGGLLAFLILTPTAYSLLPTPFSRAATVDLSLDANGITFSSSTLYVGETVRIYAKVRNIGDTDATAFVLFYQGGMIIGQTQPVSLRAGGSPDEVFVDFTVPDGSFNIRAVLQGATPQDTHPENDGAITPLYEPVADADRDGVLDEKDNCVNNANGDQLDTDHDGKGDICDTDDDGDGVLDVSDPAPLDQSVTGIVVRPAAPALVAPTSPTAPSAPSPVSNTAAPAPQPYSDEGTGTPSAVASTVASIESAVAKASSSTSKLSLSPLARFSWRQVDWRTYEFTLADQPVDGVRFGWDFGDGATSAQPKITHAFSGPGTYTVTLAIMNADGTSISDAQTFDVSFFHLDNPQVMALLGVLIAALFAFGFAFIKLRKPYDKGALHE